MKDTFTPPITSRTTEELLEIVGAPKKWNPEAVRLAKYELADRNVASIKKDTAKYLAEKRERLEKERMANEGFTIYDFTFKWKRTLFIILFSWELKKDGFDRKARQQKIIRPIIIVILIIFIISLNL